MAFILKARYNTSDARTNKKSTRKKQERFGTSHYKKYVPLILINCNKRTVQLLDTIMNHDAFEMTTEINPLSRRHDTVDNLTVDIDQQMTALLLCVVVCNIL